MRLRHPFRLLSEGVGIFSSLISNFEFLASSLDFPRLAQPPPPHRHFVRSRAIVSSAFAPAKASPCAERNLSASFLGLRTKDLCTIAANLAVMNLSSAGG